MGSVSDSGLYFKIDRECICEATASLPVFVVEDKSFMELDKCIFPSVVHSKHIAKHTIQLKDKLKTVLAKSS